MNSSYTPESSAPQLSSHARPWSRETEDVLIEGILAGRMDAFADLVQPYMVPLNRFAQRRLRSESEAEDVVQQSILLALSHLSDFRRESRFSTWLHAIANNEVFRLSQKRTSAHLPLPQPDAQQADPAISPYTQCEQKERAERLHKALTKLPEKYRLMIQLRDLRELSIDETAQSLSLSSSAVRVRHHRARKLLVRSLARLRRENSSPNGMLHLRHQSM